MTTERVPRKRRTTESMAAKALRGTASAADIKRASEALDAEEAAAAPDDPIGTQAETQKFLRKVARKRTPKPGSIELVMIPPGSPEHFDKRLRFAAREFDRKWELLESAITDAKTHAIHTALGFKSWPDYIADVASREMPNVSRSVEQRRQVVALLAGEGMSQRAIADAVGVSHPTVIRDRAAIEAEAEQVVHDVPPEPATVTGRDGKSYPAKPTPSDPKPPRREAITDAFRRLTRNAGSLERAIGRLVADDRLRRNRQSLGGQPSPSGSGGHLDDLIRLRDALDGLIEQMTRPDAR